MSQINNGRKAYRGTGRRGTVRIRKSVVLTFIFVAAVLILIDIYVFFNDVKMPIVLSVACEGIK